MEFSRQKHWSRLPFPSPGDLPKPGIEPGSPTLQAKTLPSEPLGKPRLEVFYGLNILLHFYLLSITVFENTFHGTSVSCFHVRQAGYATAELRLSL